MTPMPPRRRLATALVTFSLLGAGLLALHGRLPFTGPRGGPGESAAKTPRLQPSAVGETPSLGQGFVVWESNRSGRWRLYRRDLSGSEACLLTPGLAPQEDRLDQCCAHVSPDGTRIAYLRLDPAQPRGPRAPPPVAALHLMAATGSPADACASPEETPAPALSQAGRDRLLVSTVRLLSEQRVVVWRNDEELLFVDPAGHTQLLHLPTGSLRRLTAQPHDRDGWLMNATLTHATAGWPTFSPYLGDQGRVFEMRRYGGCQPYFSHDGRWGFWMAGAGGPLHGIELATRQVKSVLEKHDPRLPPGQGYVYFPMLSRSGDLLAFAASPDEHDFRTSNYDVFVAPTDPRTLELVGPPVRYTSDPGTDRFPDVFRQPLELGRHDGEAPHAVELEAGPESGTWSWDFGDGHSGSGATGVHVYRQPGTYDVVARQGAERLRGRIRVRPGRAPRPVSAELVGEDEIRVTFDEEVSFDPGLDLRLNPAPPPAESAPAPAIAGWRPGPRDRSLLVQLAEPLVFSAPSRSSSRVTGPRLRLDGVLDRAQRPNRMPPTEVAIDAPLWPSRRRGLVFLWQTGDAPNLVQVSAGTSHDATARDAASRTFGLEPEGLAHLDANFAMAVAGGGFRAGPEASRTLRDVLWRTNQLTLELTLEPARGGGPGRGDIVAFSRGREERENFVLYAEGGELYFRLRQTAVKLVSLAPGRARPLHLVVTYGPGRLRAYADGEPVLESEEVQGDFFRFKAYPLTFGRGHRGQNDWAGTLEGVAIYNRVLEEGEVRENARRYRALLDERPQVPRFAVRASLVATSRAPAAGELASYRQALVIHEYRVLEVESVSGASSPGPAGLVRVAHWAFLDATPLSVLRRRPGETYRLLLEPYGQHPELVSLYAVDTLAPNRELPRFYAVE